MKIEEALYILRYYDNEPYFFSRDASANIAFKMSIAALDKQIKRKPIYDKYDDNGFDEIIPYEAKCPTCGYEFEFGTWNEEENHHCICGQAIDWS